MNIPIYYNGKSFEITADDSRVAGVVGPIVAAAKDARSVLKDALSHPIQSDTLESFLSDGKNILFIVNDGDRDTPTAKVLDSISVSTPFERTRFLVATGSHQQPNEQELQTIFGSHFQAHQKRIHVHDSRDESGMEYFGKTRRGTDVRFNRLVSEADRIVVIGSVEPHYFAGFTGGRKAFLPGVAAYSTIEENHKLALEEGVHVTELDGNPVHEDMEEAFGFIQSKPVFSIQLVMGMDGKILHAAAGDLPQTFYSAVEKAKDIFCVSVREKADVVLAVASPPLDANLYQAHKAIENVRSALKEDGILILAAGCPHGTGNDSFVTLLKSADKPDAVFTRIRQGYALGYHKAAAIARLLDRAQLWAVTELRPTLLESIFIRPFDSIQTAVDSALAEKKNGKLLVVHSATTVVPVI